MELASIPDPWHFGTDPYLWLTVPEADEDPHQKLQWILECKKIFFLIFNVFINEIYNFSLTIKIKFLARKFLY